MTPPAPAAAVKTVPKPVALPEKTAAVAPVRKAEPVAVPAARKVEAPVIERNIEKEILAIVSDRTGYPSDMLDMDAAVEADLGIDSIKRVEILSAFQRTCSEAEQKQVQGLMEKLTSAKTLREIAAKLAPLFVLPAHTEMATAAAEVARSVPDAQPSASPAPSREILADLIAIVSDRTGYPADMLDVAAAIEADLGIDSIKRVEILSAFQRTCTEAEQALVQAAMEKLTSARTLAEIAERLSPVFASAAPVAAASVIVVAAPVPVAPAALSKPVAPSKPARDVLADLIAIVSDRTGYPADMLDVNAAIEADLGIDSIKRVEILSAFQRTCSETEQAQVQSIMEKLTAARTLNEIGEQLGAALPVGATVQRRRRLSPASCPRLRASGRYFDDLRSDRQRPHRLSRRHARSQRRHRSGSGDRFDQARGNLERVPADLLRSRPGQGADA